MKKLILMAALVASVFTVGAATFDCSSSHWELVDLDNPDPYAVRVEVDNNAEGEFGGWGSVAVNRWNGSYFASLTSFFLSPYAGDSTQAYGGMLLPAGYDYQLFVFDADSVYVATLYVHASNASYSSRHFENSGGSVLCN